jgi:heptosyltransferase-2
MRRESVRRIFVRAPNWVGDLIMATSAFRRIDEAFPHAHIACGLRPVLRPLLAGTPWFDEYLPMRKIDGPAALVGQVHALRAGDFDLAIVLPNSLESGLLPYLAGIPHRLGYQQGRPGLMTVGPRASGNRGWFTRHGPRRIPKPMPYYYQDLLDVLELPRVDVRPVLAVTADERARTDAWLAGHGVADTDRLVLLNAGANYGGSKLWEPERWVEIAKHFRARHALVPIFLAGPNDAALVADIARRAGAIAAVDPILPVDTLKPLAERAALMVTTDAGPRHVAVAFRLPVVCLMGPNDPRYTEYCLDETTVIRKDLECSPCQRKVCPLGHRRCMTEISTAEVLSAAERMLAARGQVTNA